MQRPAERPSNPCFGSGPDRQAAGLVGRRAAPGPRRPLAPRRAGQGNGSQAVIDQSRALLGMPDDYRLGIVPASDTGAFEMAMWSLLGARGVDVLAFESFGAGWLTDAVKQLRLEDLRALRGRLRRRCRTWRPPARTATSSSPGTAPPPACAVPDGDWIAADRSGLTICDATSAVFAMDLPWDKLDVVTWSWQKVLGGEAQHGMLVLSPRAVERLESYTPPWPLPKIFRLTKGGKLIEGIFRGETINTPSMLAVEDALDALRWAEETGRARRR